MRTRRIISLSRHFISCRRTAWSIIGNSLSGTHNWRQSFLREMLKHIHCMGEHIITGHLCDDRHLDYCTNGLLCGIPPRFTVHLRPACNLQGQWTLRTSIDSFPTEFIDPSFYNTRQLHFTPDQPNDIPYNGIEDITHLHYLTTLLKM